MINAIHHNISFVVCIMIACVATGCTTAPSHVTPEATSVGRMRQDVEFLASNLPKRHIKAFHTVKKSDFTNAVDTLVRDAEHLTDQQFAVRMKQLVVLIGDGHTSLKDNILFDRALPLRFTRFADGVFIVMASHEHESLIGKKLTHLNGRPIEEIVPLIATVISRDSTYDLHGESAPLMVYPDLLHGLGLTDDPNQVELTLRDHHQSESKVIIQTLSTSKPEKWESDPDVGNMLFARHRHKPYSHEYLEDSKLLYIAYNQCRNDAKNPFPEFAKHVLEIVDERTPCAVALDLRNNGGGDSRIIKPLIEGLIERSWLNQPDRFFVLIGPNTYSSAMMNAWQLDTHSLATLIGRPTGGKPNSYGEVKTFKLPNSGWTVRYCTKYFKMVNDDRPAIMPDVHIEPKSTDYFNGRDTLVEYMLKHSAKKTN